MSVTLLTFQPEISELKRSDEKNISRIVVTELGGVVKEMSVCGGRHEHTDGPFGCRQLQPTPPTACIQMLALG